MTELPEECDEVPFIKVYGSWIKSIKIVVP